MIKHVVMWRLRDQADGAARADNARTMKRRLEALKEPIHEIKHLEVGLNMKDSERAADVVLLAEFESREDLVIYSNHPAHQAVVAFIREIASETRVVDYEVSGEP